MSSIASSLAKHFGILQDTREVPDLWGFGWTFTIVSVRDHAFAKWRQDQRKKSPLLRIAANSAMRRAVGMGTTDTELSDKQVDEVMSRDPDESIRVTAEGVALLVRAWSGEDPSTGEPLDPFAYEDCVSLLACTDVWIPVEREDVEEEDETGKKVTRNRVKPYTGMHLGSAIAAYLVSMAEEMEAFTAKLEEEHEKNSVALSSGETAIG
jgi:hypothetical protein